MIFLPYKHFDVLDIGELELHTVEKLVFGLRQLTAGYHLVEVAEVLAAVKRYPLDFRLENQAADGEPLGKVLDLDAFVAHLNEVYATLLEQRDGVFVVRVDVQVEEEVELPGADAFRIDFHFFGRRSCQIDVVVDRQRKAELDRT